jgi:hypothetical protein
LIYGEIMQIVIAILFPGPKRKTLNHLNFWWWRDLVLKKV